VGAGQGRSKSWEGKRRLSWGRNPTQAQAPGGGRDPAGVEVVGWSMDGRAMQAMLARGGRPCSVVWWVFKGMGGSQMASWRVGPVEGSGGRGWEQLGGLPVETGTVRGMSVGIWKTAGWDFTMLHQWGALAVHRPLRQGWIGSWEGLAMVNQLARDQGSLKREPGGWKFGLGIESRAEGDRGWCWPARGLECGGGGTGRRGSRGGISGKAAVQWC